MAAQEPGEQREEGQPPGFFAVLKSVVAGVLGVRSRSAMERDMKASSPLPYILVGLAGTALFILAVVTVVKLVLRAAGL